ncbi:MAG TPA: hypothetical protein VGO92_04025 [Acidimicrobiales bacterium]|jgi:hypothetical protein|nr:hypothetical protein [Acidimicrobiales bacterium]
MRCGVLIVSLVATALLSSAMGRQARVMKATGGVGIVPLELIRSWARADPLVERWRTNDRGRGLRAARQSLLLDFAFIVAYVVLLVTLAACAADHAEARGWTGWALAARVAGGTALVAGLSDVVEDTALLLVLRGDHSQDWPRLAFWSAVVKFSGLAGAAVVLVTVGVAFAAA